MSRLFACAAVMARPSACVVAPGAWAMSGTRCATVVCCVAIGWCGGVAGQAPAQHSVEQILSEVLAGEKLSDSGRLCFNLSYHWATMTEAMTQEAKKTDQVEYSWAPGGKFRLVIWGKDGPFRTIVSDGKAIDTGDKIWDARFAFDFSPYQTKESQTLRLELDALIWPYSQILHLHIHPISEFGNKQTLESLKKRFDILIADEAPPGFDAGGTYLKLDWRMNFEREDIVQVKHEEISYVYARREAVGVRAGTYCVRSGLTNVEGVGWMPTKCAWRLEVVGEEESEASFFVSELCPKQPDPAVDMAEFVVDYEKSPMIPWPYGSRMKNFFYGIVNTFKGILEGVADGEIGD